MPTLFIWPPGAGNVTRETAEANAHYVKGPYRFEILEGARNFSFQMLPDSTTQLLLEHLPEHAKLASLRLYEPDRKLETWHGKIEKHV